MQRAVAIASSANRQRVVATYVDFPAAALTQAKLKDIRLDLTYLPSAFKRDTLNLAVSVTEK